MELNSTQLNSTRPPERTEQTDAAQRGLAVRRVIPPRRRHNSTGTRKRRRASKNRWFTTKNSQTRRNDKRPTAVGERRRSAVKSKQTWAYSRVAKRSDVKDDTLMNLGAADNSLVREFTSPAA